MRTLDFYFDFLSPYAYLAWRQAGAFCAAQRLTLRPRPMVFIMALRHWGHLGPAQIPPKRDFTFKDIQRRARDPATLNRLEKGGLIDDPASGAIDKPQALSGPGQDLGPNESARTLGLGNVDCKIVRA